MLKFHMVTADMSLDRDCVPESQKSKGGTMKKFTAKMKSLWTDESAQGATEYILILVIIVGLALTFQGQIKTAVNAQLDKLNGGLGNIKAE